MPNIRAAIIALSGLLLIGCEQKTDPPVPAQTPSVEPRNTPAPQPQPRDNSTNGHGHDGGEVVALGENVVDGLRIKASRDKGEIKPGGDAPIDIWVDGGLGEAAAVRFWIGLGDAKGSRRAKAAVEDGHWHTHAEVPDPIPADTKLWVEIEAKSGKRAVTSFELKGDEKGKPTTNPKD